MNLMFARNEIAKRGRGLTFDDVLLTPKKSEILSRKDPSLKSRITKTVEAEIPFISANMDTITEAEMAIAMHAFGSVGILHRFMGIEEQSAQVRQCREAGVNPIFASIGVGEDFLDRARGLVQAGAKVLTVDIAHGHSVQMLKVLKTLKDTFSGIEVIAGNVATPEATEELIQAGADAIKVGIGPGSMCTTRIITGCGVPQLTAIALCSEVGDALGVPIIADGGLKTSGDIMKAFAAGASSVMLGSLLSGTLETPGEIKQGKKQYRGMASRAAQNSWRGGVPLGMAPEGESTFVAIKGRASDVLLELSGGVRSGMSYLNSQTLKDVPQNALFMEMSLAGFSESRAHGL